MNTVLQTLNVTKMSFILGIKIGWLTRLWHKIVAQIGS